MKNWILPTIPFAISTTLTGICCYLAGLPRTDLVIAIVVAVLVSGSVAYGTSWQARRHFAN